MEANLPHHDHLRIGQDVFVLAAIQMDDDEPWTAIVIEHGIVENRALLIHDWAGSETELEHRVTVSGASLHHWEGDTAREAMAKMAHWWHHDREPGWEAQDALARPRPELGP